MRNWIVAIVAVFSCIVTARGDVVINEVFAGGGNSGAPFSQDYVELFNNGAVSVDLSGFTLQYATATSSTYNAIIIFGANTVIGSGQYFVITASSAGANGSPVPNVTHTGNAVNLATTGGKVRLLDNAGTPVILDLVGWGTADTREGAGNAPAMTNTTSIQRIPNGVDTNNNNVDFQVFSPSPGAANVPEPSTYVAITLGALFLITVQRLRRCRRRA